MPILLLGVSVLGFGYSSLTADVGIPDDVNRRWVFPLFNVLGQRVLPDSGRRAYFAEHGMPTDGAVLSLAGKWASSDTFAVYRDPALASFRRWVSTKGKSVYASYLLEHPGYVLNSVWTSRRAILLQDPMALAAYYPEAYRPLSSKLFGFGANLIWAGLPAALALPVYGWRRRWGSRPGDSGGLLMVAAALVPVPLLMFVSYFGDAMDVARHSVLVAVYVRLFLIYVAFLLAGVRDESRQATDG